jgi:hypothetical protein
VNWNEVLEEGSVLMQIRDLRKMGKIVTFTKMEFDD